MTSKSEKQFLSVFVACTHFQHHFTAGFAKFKLVSIKIYQN